MDKKKILLVTASFLPEISPRSFRATELAREMARQGHSVTVITPRNQAVHSLFEKENRLTIKDLGHHVGKASGFQVDGGSLAGGSPAGGPLGGTPGRGRKKPVVTAGGHHLFPSFRLVTRAIDRILELFLEYPDIRYMFMVRKALLQESGYDLLISIAVPYPVHWGVALARTSQRRIANIWVADCGDPYMGNRLDRFRKPFYFGLVEKWFMRKCDYLSITRKEFKINYYPEFHSRMVEIPQGFRFGEVKPVSESSRNGIPRFAFAGSFIRDKRDPRGFLAYLTTLKRDFRFILFTRSVELVKSFMPLLKEKMDLRDYIPREELLPQLADMDFLVNFGYDPFLQSPSKLIDYALTGRPVLNISADGFDPSVVEEFLNGDYTHRFMIPDLDHYRIEKVCGAFLKLLDGK